jgi:hypothetical protein
VISPNLIFQGNLSIGNKWDEALANKSTPVYQQKADNHFSNRCHRGRDRMVVGFTTTYTISAYHQATVVS